MSVPRTYTDRLGRDYMVDGITLAKCDNGRGYAHVRLGKHTMKQIHRIVAEAFIPNPLNLPEVNHKDGNKKNNCVENLEWVTHQGNVIHAVETGLFGERAKKATPEVWKAIGQKPLFGHHSGKQSRTFWGCFMKLEEMEMLEGME